MAEDIPRSRGIVVRFDNMRGFGFIKRDDGGEDLFVHHSAIRCDGFRSLEEGQAVEFHIALEGDRAKAVEVTGIDGSPLEQARRDDYGGVFGSRGGGGAGFGFRGGGGAGYGFSDGWRGRNSGGGGCYNCGESGHLARECRRQSSNAGGGGGCFNCGELGHLARECNQNGGRGGGGGGGGGECFSCGGFGHMARDCPSGGAGYGRRFGVGGGGGSNCYNCGNAGHFARECPNMNRSAA